MARHVHFVGSIGLDTVEEVFATVGSLLGGHCRRIPDGEVGGRRQWISWQYPLLRSSPYLRVDETRPIAGTGFCQLRLQEGVVPEEISFGELGYAREARASYLDFLEARKAGVIPTGIRFQVCLPTPFAVMGFIAAQDVPVVAPAYERAMIGEVERLCSAIPHSDLAIQWDVCLEMVMFDGRFQGLPSFPGMEQVFAKGFAQICAPIPDDVELGFHLCYGDMDAMHFVDPLDAGKAVDLANLIRRSITHKISWIHLPVPVDRKDVAYFEPLNRLDLTGGTELYLGVVGKDGVDGTKRRIAAASKVVSDFGIAMECGMARGRNVGTVRELLRTHAAALQT